MTAELITLGLRAFIVGNLVFLGTKFIAGEQNGRLRGVRRMLWWFAAAFGTLIFAQGADLFYGMPWFYSREVRPTIFGAIFLAGTLDAMWALRIRRTKDQGGGDGGSA